MPITLTPSKPRERVYIQLRRIKENKTLTNREKALAILKIPDSDVVWTDNKNELPLARRWARDELNGNNKSLAESLYEYYQEFKQSSTWKNIKEEWNDLKNESKSFFSDLYKNIIGK